MCPHFRQVIEYNPPVYLGCHFYFAGRVEALLDSDQFIVEENTNINCTMNALDNEN